jgi:hypothetical protein
MDSCNWNIASTAQMIENEKKQAFARWCRRIRLTLIMSKEN